MRTPAKGISDSDWLILINQLTDWLSACMTWLIDLLLLVYIDWLTDTPIDWLIDCLVFDMLI